MKIAKIIIVLLSAIAIISVTSEAAERRLALVIGNAAYKSSPLKNTINDANDMEKKLKTVGFDVIARINATQQDMEEAIREFGKKLSKKDVGLFYFSGHGVQYKGENYLIPIDDTGIIDTNVKYKTVPVGVLLEEMTNAGNNLNIVILDACRNYPSWWSKTAVRGLADMKAGAGMLIAYSTSPDSTASDNPSGRNGTYTANLLKYMDKPLHLLMFFQEVRKATLIDSSHQQRPWESVSITNDFYFVEAPQKPIKPDPDPIKNTPVSHKQEQPNIRSKPMTTDNSSDFKSNKGMQNKFQDNGDTITDAATGLMWQKSGSPESMDYEKAKAYIENLNHEKFAGYSDWRLPTFDELTSLLTLKRQSNDLYINPIFEKKKLNLFGTSDIRASSGTWWSVSFSGSILDYAILGSINYVRAVRSLK